MRYLLEYTLIILLFILLGTLLIFSLGSLFYPMDENIGNKALYPLAIIGLLYFLIPISVINLFYLIAYYNEYLFKKIIRIILLTAVIFLIVPFCPMLLRLSIVISYLCSIATHYYLKSKTK